MKYSVGIQTFDKIIEGGFTYVDKTDLIYSLAKEGTIYFLSRPRRFGKSLLISTLENYFLGKKDLFKGLAIEKLETEWNVYPVFHIDFNGSEYSRFGELEKKIEDYLVQWEEQYGITNKFSGVGTRFAKVLEEAHRQSGKQVVVLVDEYDKPILDALGSKKKIEENGVSVSLEENNRTLLRAFYSTFKMADNDLQFVFLVGVTKFAQVSIFSGFNQPLDISKIVKYDTLCGITSEELEKYFSQSISDLSEANGNSVVQTVEKLKKKYDGYHFSKRLKGVYNPFSLLCAFETNEIDDYWFASGTPIYLVHLLDRDDVNLDEIAGKYYMSSAFLDSKIDREAVLPMLYQSGYLTIKKYDSELDAYLLDIPNDEVRSGLFSLLTSRFLGGKEDVSSWILSVVMSLKSGCIDDFRVKLTSFFASIPYSMKTKQTSERFFHYTFYLILRLIGSYTTYTEKQQSQGRVDCVIETEKFVYIFEFKLDKTAEEALRQIKENGYAKEYLSGSRTVYAIGCNFSSKTGTIEDWKQERID